MIGFSLHTQPSLGTPPVSDGILRLIHYISARQPCAASGGFTALHIEPLASARIHWGASSQAESPKLFLSDNAFDKCACDRNLLTKKPLTGSGTSHYWKPIIKGK